MNTLTPNTPDDAPAEPSEAGSVQRVVMAAQRLVERLEHVHNDPSYRSVWTSWMIHHGQYAGPKYVEELDSLREALAGAREGVGID